MSLTNTWDCCVRAETFLSHARNTIWSIWSVWSALSHSGRAICSGGECRASSDWLNQRGSLMMSQTLAWPIGGSFVFVAGVHRFLWMAELCLDRLCCVWAWDRKVLARTQNTAPYAVYSLSYLQYIPHIQRPHMIVRDIVCLGQLGPNILCKVF